MEQNQLNQASTGLGLCGSDRETFERVWRRVMPEDRGDSPIQLIGAPVRPTCAVREEPMPCLEADSAIYGAQIQTFVAWELAESAGYTGLARRASGTAAYAPLAAIAADEKRHAKQLSTAYFLISGVEYWPKAHGSGTKGEPFSAALRSRFLSEQRAQRFYREAAAATADPCLRELYLTLAAEELGHAKVLRRILEQR